MKGKKIVLMDLKKRVKVRKDELVFMFLDVLDRYGKVGEHYKYETFRAYYTGLDGVREVVLMWMVDGGYIGVKDVNGVQYLFLTKKGQKMLELLKKNS